MSNKRNSGKGRPTPTQRKKRHRSRSVDQPDFLYWADRHDSLLTATLWLLADPADETRTSRIAAMHTMTINALVLLYGTDVPLDAVDHRANEERSASLPDLPLAVPDDVSALGRVSPQDVLTQACPPLDYLEEDGTVNPRSAFSTYLDRYLEFSLLCLHARSQETRWAGRLDELAEEAQQHMTHWRDTAEFWDPADWASFDLEEYREEQKLRLERLARKQRNSPGRTRSGNRP